MATLAKLGDACSASMTTVSPDMSAADAARVMAEGISAAPPNS